TFARTTDGGKTWSVGTVLGAEQLDFRDVEAFGETTAYLLSAGAGDASRIYKTIDGGKSWALQFQSADPAAFLDAIAFWDEQNGLALGDPINGLFQLFVTAHGGGTWKPVAAKSLPPALPGEGAFAASGTCLVTHGERDVWLPCFSAQRRDLEPAGPRGLQQRWIHLNRGRLGCWLQRSHREVCEVGKASHLLGRKPGVVAAGGSPAATSPRQASRQPPRE